MLPIITALLPILGSVMDKVIPDSAEAAKAKAEIELKLVEAANAANLAQLEVNRAEAANASVFVAGWRPAIGWIGAAALGWQFALGPLVVWASNALGHAAPPLLPIDGGMWEIIVGMLGLGGMRTWEKSRGLTR